MKTKRILAAVLSVLMVFPCASVSAEDTGTVKESDNTYADYYSSDIINNKISGDLAEVLKNASDNDLIPIVAELPALENDAKLIEEMISQKTDFDLKEYLEKPAPTEEELKKFDEYNKLRVECENEVYKNYSAPVISKYADPEMVTHYQGSSPSTYVFLYADKESIQKMSHDEYVLSIDYSVDKPLVNIDENDAVSVVYGDIDNNNTVDLSDMTMLSQYLLKDIELEGKQIRCADVNADNDVTIQDLALIKQYIMHDEVKLGRSDNISQNG